NESPVFLQMQNEVKGSKSPLKDSFTKWPNLRLVILALFGLTMGQAVIWYGGQFYALLFLTQTVRVDPVTANLMVAFALLLATPFFIFFGWLSDRIGRKWIILSGCLIAAIIYFPTFKAITHYANPALEQAIATNPVVLKANSNNCSTQFDPTGTVKFTTSCDTATAFLAKRGVPYTKLNDEAAGTGAVIMIGGKEILGFDKTDPNAKELEAKFNAEMNAALNEAKYPAKANPTEINYGMVMLLLWILVLLVTMVYGPIAALLIEMFPTRIRYTSMSLPYHIGNGWFGGFLPFIVFSIVVATGDVYQGLWYPVIVALITVVIGSLFIREGKEG
ncbi:MAG: MFS transporter, partial [Alphaproteobacteria bacterium]|nr:MFS transporter [Alphaproteobacteria bacterium]